MTQARPIFDGGRLSIADSTTELFICRAYLYVAKVTNGCIPNPYILLQDMRHGKQSYRDGVCNRLFPQSLPPHFDHCMYRYMFLYSLCVCDTSTYGRPTLHYITMTSSFPTSLQELGSGLAFHARSVACCVVGGSWWCQWSIYMHSFSY